MERTSWRIMLTFGWTLQLATLLINHAFGQERIQFHHFSLKDGLSHNAALSITQDAGGYMWFGTRFGLNQYDTNKVKAFQSEPGDTASLSSSSYIKTLLCDSENTLWVGTSHGLNKYIPETETFQQILNDPSRPYSLSDNVINVIAQDSFKNLWVGTKKGLNLLTAKNSNSFQSFLANMDIHTLLSDRRGILWVGSSQGLLSMDCKKKPYKFKTHSQVNQLINSTPNNNITSLTVDRLHNLWIGTSKGGLIRFNLADGSCKIYQEGEETSQSLSGSSIRKLMLDKNGLLWIGTQKGLTVLNTATGATSIYRHDPGNPNSLSHNSIYDIFRDNHGSVWIGTYFGGINVVYPDLTPFRVFQESEYKNSISSNIISGICQDASRNLWIGTDGEGVNLLNTKTGVFTSYKHNPSDASTLSSNMVKTVYKDKSGKIWVGTHLGGLSLFIPESQCFVNYAPQQNMPTSISSSTVNCILEDSQGRFWVGTNVGLNMLDRNTGAFSLFGPSRPENNDIAKAIVVSIFEDRERNIWVGTTEGFYQLKNHTENFVFCSSNTPNSKQLRAERINCINEDSEGNIWVGSYTQGLSMYSPSTKTFVTYTVKDGLPGNNILGILVEKAGVLWLSTDKGISRFNTHDQTFRNYNTHDGLPDNSFNEGAFFKDDRGQMFFGGYSGLVSFFPSEFRQNHYSPPVVFTGIKLFNKPLPPKSPYTIKQNAKGEQSITLEHSQNIFTIEFACLNYIKSGNNSYAYKLEGFEKNWNYVTVPTVTYTNLHEGSYTFLVRGRNNDGIWSKATSKLTVKILPPLWRTWWAYLLYFLLAFTILFITLRYFLMRELLKKEQEMHQLKLNFFTNISHEIRTPLTLILVPLEKMLAGSSENTHFSPQLQSMKDNADRLMRLITELLDFRKADAGLLQLQVSETNIVTFARNAILFFQELALSRGIEFVFTCDKENIKLYFDKIQLEKVFLNLLSNAFKFCRVGGTIELKIVETATTVEISVLDNGIGIPLDKQDKLFRTFYQVNNSNGQIGSGVGLAFTKSIVELHGGTIHVQSRPESDRERGYTCFMVSMKKGTAHFTESQLTATDLLPPWGPSVMGQQLSVSVTCQPPVNGPDEQQKTILLIEDNLEVRQLLQDALSVHYTVLACADGLQGLNAATTQIPDLIISDIMLPGMDGLELCTKIKLDERSSHIPVILLTARAAPIHQLEGLQTGADMYLVKPFSLQVLELNIRNLLASRELMRQKYCQKVTLEPTNVTIDAPEQRFLNKIIHFIEQHMSDPDFNVPLLSLEMGMSQPVLYKKIRALTDLSVNDFIKSIKLKRAAQMLQQNILSVSEVAYAVGFSDPKYFSKEFKKQFGTSPTGFIKNNIAAESPA